MPPDNGYVAPRLGLNGVQHLRKPAATPCGVRPVLVGLGRGWAARRAALCLPCDGRHGVSWGVSLIWLGVDSSHKTRNFAPRNPTRRGAFLPSSYDGLC
jgi:hypothetical protein